MKKVCKFSVLTISLLISGTSFSQCRKTVTDTILIDFLDLKSISKLEHDTVKYGDKYVIKIVNINQSLYKIDDSVTGKDYNTEMPDIFKGVKLPGHINLKFPEIPKQLDANQQNESFDKATGAAKAPVDPAIKENIDIIKKSMEGINATAKLNNKFINLANNCSDSFRLIEKMLKDDVNTYLKTNITDRNILASSFQKELEAYIDDAVEAKRVLDSIVPVNSDLLNNYMEANGKQIDSLEKALKAPHANKNQIQSEESEIKSLTNQLKEFADSLTAVVKTAGEYEDSLEKFRDDNKIQELVNNFNMINYWNFTYVTNSLKAKKDELKFDINISTDKPLACSRPHKVNISETYYTKGGIKIDFSTGVFVNMGNADFLGRDLQYKKLTDSTEIIQAKGDANRALIGVGALVHVYCRTGHSVNFGGAAGISTTTAFDGLCFHLGPSLSFGRENRICLSGGITLRESTILDRDYDYTTTYRTSLMPDAPPTTKAFPQTGCFLSLTYNWLK